MKKIILSFFGVGLFLAMSSSVFAGDCFQDPIYDRDWNAEVTTGAFVRDVACMEGSEVITTLSVGTIIHVIAETDGWYKIETSEGIVGWVGQWLIAPTSKSFTMDESVDTGCEGKEFFCDIYGHKYQEAIFYIYDLRIVSGYPDGSYKPDNTINRAELLKIIIEAVYEDEFESYSNSSCFNDVPVQEWYTKYVCFAKNQGVVVGYSGNLFKPAQEITFVEALKITMMGFGYEYAESTPWYKDIVMVASDYNFIPLDVTMFNQEFTRGQMAEMIARMIKYENGELETYLGEDYDKRVTYDMLK